MAPPQLGGKLATDELLLRWMDAANPVQRNSFSDFRQIIGRCNTTCRFGASVRLSAILKNMSAQATLGIAQCGIATDRRTLADMPESANIKP